MSEHSIIVNGLWKKFSTIKKPHDEFWILKDINFGIKPGEIVGIIGKNGSGKSTLLRIISGIMLPSRGYVESFGKCSSMLELGTGFHPEFTGRENIYLSGSILGLKKKEIDEIYESIISFSGIKKFIDEPVKHYSSGMYARLAFAVSFNIDADIMLVDEVLSVGDESFQQKCLKKISDLSNGGKTFIIVSHDMSVIETICNRAIVIHNNKVLHDGNQMKSIEMYKSIVGDELI